MIARWAPLLLLLSPAPPPAGGTGTWSVEDSTEVRTRLDGANRLLGRGLLDQAVPLLQEILDRWPDHLVRDATDPLRFDGAREVVLRLLREGKPETRRAYEAFAGPLAEAAVGRAARTGDAAGLERDARRYGAAGSAGARLLLAAADLRLARGEPGRAAACLRVLLREHPGDPAAGPAAAARLARALARTGDREGIHALGREFAARAGEAVRTGEGETTLGAVLEEALAAVGPGPRSSDTPMLGGAPDRRGRGLPAEPLGPPRWIQGNGNFAWTPMDDDQAQKEPAVEESLKRSQPVAAALVDGILYFHWSQEVVARDLYTGRERWRYRAPGVPRIGRARTHGSLMTCPAVADGVVYAPLQVWPEGEIPREFVFADQVIIPHIPVRRLFALDAATGAVLWSHRDADRFGPAMKGPLRLLNLTSPPLVLGDLVVGAGAVSVQGAGFDAWCIAADRRTGEIRWTSRLGFGQQELNLFGRKVKEVPAAAVSSDGRRLFVQTNMGLVSCLDPSTGLPLWTRGYRQVEIPLYDNFWTTPERRFTWSGSPPVSAGGLVLVAPADGEALLALRADTGALAWAVPCRDGQGWESPHMYRLLGADDGLAFVAGHPSVRAFDLRTGRLAWEFPFPAARSQERSGGRGVVADGTLLVPSNRAVYALDTRAGGALLRRDSIVDPRSPADAGGNLVVAEGASALLRLEECQAHFRPEDVRVRAQALLRDRPGSVDAMLEAARIYLAADRPGDALPLLQEALRAVAALPPAERAHREPEVRASLSTVQELRAVSLAAEGKAAEAREAFAAAADIAPASPAAAAVLLRGAEVLVGLEPSRLDHAAALVESLLDGHGSAVMEGQAQLLNDEQGRCTSGAYALWCLALWQERDGSPDASVESLQRILERPAGDLLFGDSARARARARIDEMVESHGPGIYAPFERRAEEALEAARGARDPAALDAVAERWPNARAAVRAALEQARLRLDGGDAAAVVASMRALLSGAVRDGEAAEAHWLLAEGLVRTGRAAAARATLQRLARRYGEATIPFAESRVRAADAVARRLEAVDLKAPPSPTPGLPATGPLRELWSLALQPGEAGHLLDTPGDPLPGGKVLFVRGDSLEAFEAATGRPAWKVTDPVVRGVATSSGGVLVFGRDAAAAGIDPASGDEIWRVGLPGPVRDAAAADSMVVFLIADASDPFMGRLMAFDAATGEQAWAMGIQGVSSLRARGGAILCDGTGNPAPLLRVVRAADGVLLPFVLRLRRGRDMTAEVLRSPAGPLVLRREGTLDGFDPLRGTPLWIWAAPGNPRLLSAAAGEGFAAALDEKESLHGVDLAAGRTAWSVQAGKGRMFDPSATALVAEGRTAYALTVSSADHAAPRVEARDPGTGSVRWSAPLGREPALVEILPAGETVLVKYLGTGGGKTGTAVFNAATGAEVDRFEDGDGRLGGEGFDAAPVSGVLVLANERVVIVRGR